MKLYLLSLAVGLMVGAIYALVGVRSPAPPVVALVGLLGILVGEQLVPIVRNLMARTPLSAAEVLADCREHVLGELPGRPAAKR
uniref:XapX domain-containing protein n=2 Tax=Enterobacterales TaxID=91347 RepID=UPI0013D45266